jgi:hypothetical protein
VRSLRTIALVCGTAAALIGPSLAAAHPFAVGCQAEAGKRVALTPSYRYALLIGPVEDMFMPRQVRATHPKHGEVMLGGTMTGAEMLTGGPIRHLEIQICTRRTRAVVTAASPTIVVRDQTLKRTERLPIAVMEGIGEGVADLHYGNNVAMPAWHRYVVAVSWRGERVRFQLAPSR